MTQKDKIRPSQNLKPTLKNLEEKKEELKSQSLSISGSEINLKELDDKSNASFYI